MKIYFAGSIRGGRERAKAYPRIVELLSEYGDVLTEFVADQGLSSYGEASLSDAEIFRRDTEWLDSADAVVAEVTAPSLGVGYELGRAEAAGKRVLCVHDGSAASRLSAMVAGCPAFECARYESPDDLRPAFDAFFGRVLR